MSRSPKTSGAPQMHAVQLDLDEKPGPNEPPPPTGTQVTDRHWYPPPAGRSLGNAFFHVLAWASGYAAAQFWYEWTGQVVLVSTSDEMLGDFATLDAAGHWTGTFSSVETTHAVAALVGTNVLFAVIAYLLLKFQVWAHTKKEGSALLQMMLVGFTRVIDAHVDGATFFSTNMLFVVLVSAFSWGAPMLPRLLGFSVGLTLVLLLLTLLSEQIPRWLHESGLLGSSKQYSAAAQHTTEVVNDWFIGQWQWLLGFAWWNSWLVLLTSDYLDVFHYRSAWWALCGVLFLLFVLVAIVLPALAPSLIELKRTVATHPSTRARRLLPMLIKSFRWVLAIGLFFTLRRQFAVFDQGLSLKDVSLMDLGGYCVAVSAASVFGVFLLETILRVQRPGQH